MCIGIPGEVLEVNGQIAQISVGGVIKEVLLDLVEDITIGNYVIIHAGFAIQKLDKDEAIETLKLMSQVCNELS
ncbi:MAG: HypC/HybG/HupF family hydrogenase formation chaperone [bacterium]